MPKPNALNELLDSTQPMLAGDKHAMPDTALCECQSCPEHDPSDTGEPCENTIASGLGYLVERAGYSCIDCLPMMIEIGLAMTADSIEPTPGEPTYVRVANFMTGSPTFRA